MIKDLIALAKSEDIEIEVFVTKDNDKEIIILNGTIETINTQNVKKYKIKAIYKGKTIVITTNQINPNELIKAIKENVDMSDNTSLNNLSTNQNIVSSVINDENLDYNNIIQNLLDLSKIKEKYPKLSFLSIYFNHYYEVLEIINEDSQINDSNYYNSIVIEFVAKDNDRTRTGILTEITKNYQLDNIKEKLKEKIENTIEELYSQSCKTSKYNILLENNCVYKILNSFSSMFSAESIYKQCSILMDKFNEKVFSDKLAIVEDPTNEELIGKRLFDDEGTITSYKEIIKDGRFVQKLYDKQSAIRENTESTGNSYGLRNMYILPGKKTNDELIKELNEGIVITNIEGLHAGVNTFNGQISLQADGWSIKDGKKDRPLNMLIMSTNIFELFNNIIDIGNDLKFFSKIGGAPSLLVKDITIAGKE